MARLLPSPGAFRRPPFMPSAGRLIPLLAAALALIAPPLAQAEVPDVSRAEALRALDRAEAALSGSGSVPGPQALSAEAVGSREATIALRDLAIALPALTGAERRRAAELLARPTDPDRGDYFGPEADASPICDARFCVHWSRREGDRPLSQGYIDQVVAAADETYAVENGELGWREPKPDGSRGSRAGEGAEGQTDVYIAGLARRLYGFASTDPGQNGARRSSYLVVDNDYAGFSGAPVELMRATVAHEYNHVLQYGYDTFEQVWMFESTATWMEEQVYPGVDDYLNYLSTFAATSQVPLTKPEFKVYGSAVWNHWLTARLGAETVRDAWARSTDVNPRHFAVAAYGRAIEENGGGSFSRQFGKFAIETSEWIGSNAFPDADPIRTSAAREPCARDGGRSDSGWTTRPIACSGSAPGDPGRSGSRSRLSEERGR